MYTVQLYIYTVQNLLNNVCFGGNLYAYARAQHCMPTLLIIKTNPVMTEHIASAVGENRLYNYLKKRIHLEPW